MRRDTLRTGHIGDFGPGWSMSYGDGRVATSGLSGSDEGWGDGPAFTAATTVTLTLPGGERHRFAFTPRPLDNLFSLDYTPAFVNVNATGATLEVEGDFIRPMDDGVFVRSGMTQQVGWG